MSFETIYITGSIDLTSIDPFTTHKLLTNRRMHKFQSTIVFNCMHFINHGLLPSRMIKCCMNIVRNNNGRQGGNKRIMKETYDGKKKIINRIWITSRSNIFLKSNKPSMIKVKRRQGGSESRGSSGKDGVICVWLWYVRRGGGTMWSGFQVWVWEMSSIFWVWGMRSKSNQWITRW